MQRFGRAPQKGQKYVDRVGVYAVLPRGKQLLLTHQARPLDELQLPGGGIDPGESPLQALHREVREETGWTIQIFRKIGICQRYTFMPDYDIWARKICHMYLGAPVLRSGPPSEPHHRPVWLDVHQVTQHLGNSADRYYAGYGVSLR
jgi:8-oxo-dGTP diphosphatase